MTIYFSPAEYGFNAGSVSTPEKSTLTWHRIVEAMKFAYAKRSSLGDPDKENQSFKDGIESVSCDEDQMKTVTLKCTILCKYMYNVITFKSPTTAGCSQSNEK